MFEDENYAIQMITYLDTIILCYINGTILQTPILLSNQYINLVAYKYEFDFDWLGSINHNSNVVTVVKHIYNFSNNATYFKYAYRKSR